MLYFTQKKLYRDIFYGKKQFFSNFANTFVNLRRYYADNRLML